jgi:hypothetical protein
MRVLCPGGFETTTLMVERSGDGNRGRTGRAQPGRTTMNIAIQPLLLLLALSTSDSTAYTPSDPTVADANEAPRAAAGLYVFTDPATGELVSPSDQQVGRIHAELGLPDWEVEQALRTDSADLIVETDAFGALSVDLQGRFQSALYGRVDADGATAVDHVELSTDSESKP